MQFPTEGRSSGLRNLSSAKPLLFVHQNVHFYAQKSNGIHYVTVDYAILKKKLPKSSNITSFHFQGQA